MRTFTILMLIGLLTTCLISVTYAEEEAKAKADDKEEGSDVASDEDASDDDASDDEGSDDEDDDDDDDEDGSDIDEGTYTLPSRLPSLPSPPFHSPFVFPLSNSSIPFRLFFSVLLSIFLATPTFFHALAPLFLPPFCCFHHCTSLAYIHFCR
eukprot:TRINITY_DN101_c1_g1_i1.p2 TRINITY_DN101_c1_g1~~TRINITY_DN101_c1_g1_i1.p2  ORF type:complete len:153 (-),score=29.68 TRINITY_DN101_c1_g1_i1:358-816(-)